MKFLICLIVTMSFSAFSAYDPRLSFPTIAGESYFSGTTSCTWSRTSATVGALTATAACPGPTIVISRIGTWLTTDADLPRQTVNSLPKGVYKATFVIPVSNSGGLRNVISINDGSTTCEPVMAAGNSSQVFPSEISCVFSYASSGNRVFELYVASSSGTVNLNNDQTSPRYSVKFRLEYWGPI